MEKTFTLIQEGKFVEYGVECVHRWPVDFSVRVRTVIRAVNLIEIASKKVSTFFVKTKIKEKDSRKKFVESEY